MRKSFIGGNWKSHNTLSETQNMVTTIIDKLQFDPARVDVVVSPVYLHLVTVLFTKKQENVEVAAQNCSMHTFGPYTGEITAEQLKDINIKWVILGHSERRIHYKETNQQISQKVEQAFKVGLKVIFCFGETLEQRDAGKTINVIQQQLEAIKDKVTNWNNVVLAYEPVWAIGTGKTANNQQVKQIHTWIRKYLNKIGEQTEPTRIIYGGSVNETNCTQLIQIQTVDGFLVGGASLKPTFLEIVQSSKLKK